MALNLEGKQDCLKVLGLDSSASYEEITKKYKELALQNHPDQEKNIDKPEVLEKFHQISHAFLDLKTKYRESTCKYRCCQNCGRIHVIDSDEDFLDDYYFNEDDDEDDDDDDDSSSEDSLESDQESMSLFYRKLFMNVFAEYVFEKRFQTRKKPKNQRFTKEEEEEDKFFDLIYQKYRLSGDHGDYMLTEEDLHKFHSYDEWLKDRDPKKRHNHRVRKAKKKSDKKVLVEKNRGPKKKQLLTKQFRRQKEMKEIAEELKNKVKQSNVGNQKSNQSERPDSESLDEEVKRQHTENMQRIISEQEHLQKIEAIEKGKEKKQKKKEMKKMKKQVQLDAQKKIQESKSSSKETLEKGLSIPKVDSKIPSNCETSKEKATTKFDNSTRELDVKSNLLAQCFSGGSNPRLSIQVENKISWIHKSTDDRTTKSESKVLHIPQNNEKKIKTDTQLQQTSKNTPATKSKSNPLLAGRYEGENRKETFLPLSTHSTNNTLPSAMKPRSNPLISAEQTSPLGSQTETFLPLSTTMTNSTASDLLQKHLAQYNELMNVQPKRHTEQQLKVERSHIKEEQLKRQGEELTRLRDKHIEKYNKSEVGDGSSQSSPFDVVVEEEFERMRKEHLRKQQELERKRNEEEMKQLKMDKRGHKWQTLPVETKWYEREGPTTPRPKSESAMEPPSVNVWQRRAHRQIHLESLRPKSTQEEEDLVKKAMELSCLTAKEEEEKRLQLKVKHDNTFGPLQRERGGKQLVGRNSVGTPIARNFEKNSQNLPGRIYPNNSLQEMPISSNLAKDRSIPETNAFAAKSLDCSKVSQKESHHSEEQPWSLVASKKLKISNEHVDLGNAQLGKKKKGKVDSKAKFTQSTAQLNKNQVNLETQHTEHNEAMDYKTKGPSTPEYVDKTLVQSQKRQPKQKSLSPKVESKSKALTPEVDLGQHNAKEQLNTDQKGAWDWKTKVKYKEPLGHVDMNQMDSKKQQKKQQSTMEISSQNPPSLPRFNLNSQKQDSAQRDFRFGSKGAPESEMRMPALTTNYENLKPNIKYKIEPQQPWAPDTDEDWDKECDDLIVSSKLPVTCKDYLRWNKVAKVVIEENRKYEEEQVKKKGAANRVKGADVKQAEGKENGRQDIGQNQKYINENVKESYQSCNVKVANELVRDNGHNSNVKGANEKLIVRPQIQNVKITNENVQDINLNYSVTDINQNVKVVKLEEKVKEVSQLQRAKQVGQSQHVKEASCSQNSKGGGPSHNLQYAGNSLNAEKVIQKRDFTEVIKRDNVKEVIQSQNVKNDIQRQNLKQVWQTADVKKVSQTKEVKKVSSSHNIGECDPSQNVGDNSQKQKEKDFSPCQDVKKEIQNQDVKAVNQKGDMKEVTRGQNGQKVSQGQNMDRVGQSQNTCLQNEVKRSTGLVRSSSMFNKLQKFGLNPNPIKRGVLPGKARPPVSMKNSQDDSDAKACDKVTEKTNHEEENSSRPTLKQRPMRSVAKNSPSGHLPSSKVGESEDWEDELITVAQKKNVNASETLGPDSMKLKGAGQTRSSPISNEGQIIKNSDDKVLPITDLKQKQRIDDSVSTSSAPHQDRLETKQEVRDADDNFESHRLPVLRNLASRSPETITPLPLPRLPRLPRSVSHETKRNLSKSPVDPSLQVKKDKPDKGPVPDNTDSRNGGSKNANPQVLDEIRKVSCLNKNEISAATNMPTSDISQDITKQGSVQIQNSADHETLVTPNQTTAPVQGSDQTTKSSQDRQSAVQDRTSTPDYSSQSSTPMTGQSGLTVNNAGGVNSLPVGLPPHLVQAYLQYLSSNSVQNLASNPTEVPVMPSIPLLTNFMPFGIINPFMALGGQMFAGAQVLPQNKTPTPSQNVPDLSNSSSGHGNLNDGGRDAALALDSEICSSLSDIKRETCSVPISKSAIPSSSETRHGTNLSDASSTQQIDQQLGGKSPQFHNMTYLTQTVPTFGIAERNQDSVVSVNMSTMIGPTQNLSLCDQTGREGSKVVSESVRERMTERDPLLRKISPAQDVHMDIGFRGDTFSSGYFTKPEIPISRGVVDRQMTLDGGMKKPRLPASLILKQQKTKAVQDILEQMHREKEAREKVDHVTADIRHF